MPALNEVYFLSGSSENWCWRRREIICRVETESGGTRRRTGGEVKGKKANGVGNQAVFSLTRNSPSSVRVETESGGTRRRTGGEVKGKNANGVGSQAVFSFTQNSPSSVTTIVLPRPALQESQYSTELTPPPI